MQLVVVMEDDAGTRMLVSSVLRKDGYEVLAAENGAQGLRLVQDSHPALVVSDVQMPEMNGFEMLAALRTDASIATTPVILLTSLQERAHMRQGMTIGADDYITKPFHPAELRQAAAAQLNKRQMSVALHDMAVQAAVSTALTEQKQNLAKLYERRLYKEIAERWPTPDANASDERFEKASVLFVDMLHYSAMAEKLTSTELADLVRRFYESVGDTVHLFGARHMQFIGEGLLATFVDSIDPESPDPVSANHGLRALRAAFGMIDSSRRMRSYQDAHLADRGLPRFGVSVALHSGPVTLTKLQDPLHGNPAQTLPMGDAVVVTMQLQKRTHELGWQIAASVPMLRTVTGAVTTGGRSLVQIPGREQPLDAAELTGLAL